MFFNNATQSSVLIKDTRRIHLIGKPKMAKVLIITQFQNYIAIRRRMAAAKLLFEHLIEILRIILT